MVLDWLWSNPAQHDPNEIVDPPQPPPTDPDTLPYAVSRVVFMKQSDAPFFNSYWDYPTKSATRAEVIFSDPVSHDPLFTSKDQLIASEGICAGKFLFKKPIDDSKFMVDSGGAILTKAANDGFVVSHVGDPHGYKCASSGGMIPADFRIGGGGPGSAEMSAKISGGIFKSKIYQQLGPHYLGQKLKDGTMCIEPSAVEARARVVNVIRSPDAPKEIVNSLTKIKSE